MNSKWQLRVADEPHFDDKQPPQTSEKQYKKRVSSNSNHLTPTIFLLENSTVKPVFSALKNSVADKSGSKIKRKPLKNAMGYPYREARLVHHNYSLEKKWFILFYAYDIGLKKLVRKRGAKEELNSIIDLNERLRKADQLIRELNHDLKSTGYIESAPKKKPEIRAFNFHGYKLANALEWLYNYEKEVIKRRKNTLDKFKYLKKTVIKFLNENEISDLLLREINSTFSHRLSEWLRDQGIGNRTHNYLMESLRTAINKLRGLDESLFPNRNPVVVKKYKVTKLTHAAYSTTQLKAFIKLIEKKDAQLLLFIRFIYYTLARPKEIKLIKVGHIHLDIKQIMMSGADAKTSIEKYIGISDEFARIIRASGILKYPSDYYVFSALGVPSTVPAGTNYFYKRFKTYIDELGFKKINNRYTLYSFKHTGAIQLYMATKDAELVQRQCRHTSMTQTQTYLQELGQFTNFTGLENWKGM